MKQRIAILILLVIIIVQGVMIQKQQNDLAAMSHAMGMMLFGAGSTQETEWPHSVCISYVDVDGNESPCEIQQQGNQKPQAVEMSQPVKR